MTSIRFESIPIKECNEPLEDVHTFGLLFEPMYFNQGLSDNDGIFLRKTLINKLLIIQNKLKNYGYKFKIWDGFRSRNVQENIYTKFWHELKNKNPDWGEEKLNEEVSVFVTNPNNNNRIPPHSTGGSVDLTIVDESGSELDMGTSFDYFGNEAASLFYEENNINDIIKNNRRILREAMLSEYFRFDKDEWWHFDYGNQLWAFEYQKAHAIYGECKIK